MIPLRRRRDGRELITTYCTLVWQFEGKRELDVLEGNIVTDIVKQIPCSFRSS
jgi:hypothetical protein